MIECDEAVVELPARRHPNTGPCQRCWEYTAPRYGNGFDDGASPHCRTCRPIIANELAAERQRQKGLNP